MHYDRSKWRKAYPGTNGAIIYRGPSQIDPSVQIVVIVTGLSKASANAKTADMLQTWILVDSPDGPQDVARNRADFAICGNCPHRYNPETGKRSCYVLLHQGPRSVHDAYLRGKYPEVSPARLSNFIAGAFVRFGSYGDPAAVPLAVWLPLRHTAKGHSGYTHHWQHLAASLWAPLLMASTDSDAESDTAESAGWRQFRVLAVGARHRTLAKLRICPATTPANLSCSQCRACDGTSRGAKRPSIAIEAHGNGAKYV